MGKSKSKSKTPTSSLPKAPWLYINDTTSDETLGDAIVGSLVSLIPKAKTSPRCSAGWVPNFKAMDDTVVIFADRELDFGRAVQTANARREKAIELGKNFASVNLTNNTSAEYVDKVDWGTNHLDVNTSRLTARAAAEKIFRWLCKLPYQLKAKSLYCLPALP